ADEVLAKLGGIVPPTALILPVVMRSRVVAVVYAHRGNEALSVPEIADILPLAAETASALAKLILKAKSAGYGRASEPHANRSDDSAGRRASESGRLRRSTEAPIVAAAEAPSSSPSSSIDDMSVPVPMPADGTSRRPIDAVLDTIEAGGPSASAANDEAIAR